MALYSERQRRSLPLTPRTCRRCRIVGGGAFTDTIRRSRFEQRHRTRRSAIRLRYAGPLGPSSDPPMDRISPDDMELNLDSLWIPICAGFGTSSRWDAEIRGVGSDLEVVAPGALRARAAGCS